LEEQQIEHQNSTKISTSTKIPAKSDKFIPNPELKTPTKQDEDISINKGKNNRNSEKEREASSTY